MMKMRAEPSRSARIEDLSLTASDVSTAKGQRSNIALKLKLDKTGSRAASGPVSLNRFRALED